MALVGEDLHAIDFARFMEAGRLRSHLSRIHMPDPSPLPRNVRAVLGSQAGEDFVTWLDSAHGNLRDGMRADLAEVRRGVRADMQDLRADMKSDMQELRAGMQADMQAMERRMSDHARAMEDRLIKQIHAVDVRVADSKAELMRWSLVYWVGAVGAIAALAGVLRSS